MTERISALWGCGATIADTEADMAAGPEILAGIRRAQIELRGCKVLRYSRRMRPLFPICGCCLVLWQRCCFRLSRQLMFHRDADDRHCSGGREIAEVMRDVASNNQNLRTVSDSAAVSCVQSLEYYQDTHLSAARYIQPILKIFPKCFHLHLCHHTVAL